MPSEQDSQENGMLDISEPESAAKGNIDEKSPLKKYMTEKKPKVST